MAVGRRLISIVTCTFFAQGLKVVCAQGTFGSDAIAGIVVACVAVLIIVIGGVVVYLVWRSRRRAAKNTNSAAAAAAQESASVEGGHARPADIPIEAVNRIPPPAYALPTPTRRPPGSHHRRPRTQNGSTTLDPHRPPQPPPPYSSPQGNDTAVNMSCDDDEAPPEYRSRVGLNNSVEPRRSDPPSASIESFVEYPSMRNILLTSSRSSLQGTDSRHASTQSDRSSSGGGGGGAVVSMSPAGGAGPSSRRRHRRRRDSAQGDSAYSKSSRSDDVSLRQTQRSISTSSSALNDPRVSVPEGGLQRTARRSKKQTETGNGPGALNRSCPSLVDEAAKINTSHHQQLHHYDDDDNDEDDDHHHHCRRRVESEERQVNPKSESTKRGRYQRRRGRDEARTARLSSSTEYSDDQLHVHRGYSTDSDLTSGSRAGLGGRYQIAGTTEV